MAGMIADRFIASQKLMAIMHFASSVVLFLIPSQLHAHHQGLFLFLLFLHNMFYLPTTALTNNISFRNLATNNAKAYAYVRVFGTVGFMGAGVFIGQLGFSASTSVFYVTAIVSLVQGVYSLTLPNTPPLAKGATISWKDFLYADAFKMFTNKSFLVFMICSVIVFVPQAAYQSFLSLFLSVKGFQNIATIITIGPVSEIFVLLLLPFLLTRLGFKNIFLLGTLLWVIRLCLFSFTATSSATALIIFGIVLHGACWDFFFTTGEIYTDRKAGPAVKARAQGMYKVFTQGIGWAIGGYLAGNIFNNTVTKEGTAALPQWQIFWLYPAVVALFVGLIFLFFFKDKFLNQQT